MLQKIKLKNIEMITKICGILLITFGGYLFKLGLEYDDTDCYHMMNIRLIGAAFLLVIGGLALLFTD